MKASALSDQQRLSWLRLLRSERVGPITFFNFVKRFGSADNALLALPQMTLKSSRTQPAKICSAADAERELDEAAKLGIRHIAIGEQDYPRLLREIDDPPPLLLTKGSLDINSAPKVAIVGSRNASMAGQKLSGAFAHDLARAGFFVVSGLARGIDTAAHKAALELGTVAVLAGGHGAIYPTQNIPLAEAILDHNGALISETPPWFSPRAKDFPRRNRLVSGVSNGVLVVEAAKRSGSLITARLAGEHNRHLFAIPGSPLDPRAQGANQLIRQGATLVQTPEDIVEDLSSEIQAGFFEQQSADDISFIAGPLDDIVGADDKNDQEALMIEAPHFETILNGLSATPLSIDDIIRLSELSPQLVISALCELEFSGQVERLEANSYRRI